MKRSLSESNTDYKNDNTKRIKSNDDDTVPKNQEYLQVVLARIVELQQQINEDDYDYSDDETSDLGDSESEDTDDDIMKEVLSKVFEGLPRPPQQENIEFVNHSQKSLATLKFDIPKDKNVELYGFKVCRKVATNFIEDMTCSTPFQHFSNDRQNCYLREAEFERSKQLLRNFDLHLAAKERDYAARLMEE